MREWIATLCLAAGVPCSAPIAASPKPQASPVTPPKPASAKVESFKQEIPGAAFSIDMIPILPDATIAAKGLAPFFISATEISWDAYDAFVFNRDDEKGMTPLTADAVTRPSRPYIPPDCGFGHAGYPAICVHLNSVVEYCRWLSARTGLKYRLPTEAEWEFACAAGSSKAYSFGEDAKDLGDYAWLESNSDESPHPVGKKKPNAWGLYDMHGNVSEWVTGTDGKKIVKGGSWQDKPEGLTTKTRLEYTIKWQKTDPQIPKSKWWMSDGQHVGFRVVCEADAATGKPLKAADAKPDAKPVVKPDDKAPDAKKTDDKK